MVEAGLVTLGILVAVATAARFAARAATLPPAAVYLAAGFLARPVLPGDDPFLQDLVLVAVAFLMFAAGAQFHPWRFSRAIAGKTLAVGVGTAVLVGAAAAGLAAIAGWRGGALPYAAAVAGLSSTLIVLQALAIRGEAVDAHGRLLGEALLAQDALALALLVALPPLPQDPTDSVRGVIALAAFALVAALVRRAARARVTWRVAGDLETRTLLAFGVAAAFMLAAAAVGVPIVAGAFLAGLAVAVYPADVHARPAVRAAREFFTPVLFVALGALASLPLLADVPLLVGLLALVLLAKPVVWAALSRAVGFTRGAAARAGVLVGQGSELALVLAVAGLLAGDLAPREGGLLVLVIAASILASSLVPARASRALERVLPPDEPPPPVPRSGHVVVLGAGNAGGHLVGVLRDAGESVVAVDEDPHALARLPAGVPRILGDATHADVLDAARVSEARAVVALLRNDDVTERAMRQVAARTNDGPRSLVARVLAPDRARALAGLEVRSVHAADLVGRSLSKALDDLASERAAREDV